jgi:DNA-binding response OmpR family regulator
MDTAVTLAMGGSVTLKTKLPDACRVLIVEDEPVQALALECVLEELGCRAMGPVWQAQDIGQLLRREPPSFALVDSNLRDHLIPAVECLNLHRVPFALLAMGAEGEALERVTALRDRPRIDRPFHGPTVYEAARQLYRTSLIDQVARADARIAQGQVRLAEQQRRVERGASCGDSHTATSQILADELARALQMMCASRELLLAQLSELTG